MLYGRRESLDNRCATIVSSADSAAEYEAWVANVLGSPLSNYVEIGVSELYNHLFSDELKGYKQPVLLVYHDGEVQREQFINKWEISIVQPFAARDKQKDMIWHKQQNQGGGQSNTDNATTEKTLSEIHGLADNDPWDKRTPDEIAQDEAIKKRMHDLQKSGEISGDSFGDPGSKGKEKTPKDTAHVTDIYTSTNADGSVIIETALARKANDTVDEDLIEKSKQPEKKKRIFSPEDFAAVLAGDGSADHLNIPASASADKLTRSPGSKELALSPEAEEARREHREEKERIAAAQAAHQRSQEDVIAKKEHSEGKFRGCDLLPDQKIVATDIPPGIIKGLEAAGIKQNSYPFKDYPYNSQIGEFALLPSDGLGATNPFRISDLENLEVIGVVSMDDPMVMVVKKTDPSKAGWAVYSRKNTSSTDGSPIWNISLVRVR